MEENPQRQVRKVDNSSYRERFQFLVKVNDNIICQRYFRINRFNSDSLGSEELFDTLRGVVRSIKRDLESKSRIYLWATQGSDIKLTGFADDDGNVQNEPTYIHTDPTAWGENEFVDPWDVVFHFMFLVDDKVVFDEGWDGSVYPKYVRNSVDITNSGSQYPIVRMMNHGKDDLVVDIIKRICSVCSGIDDDSQNRYTKSTMYGVDGRFADNSGIGDDFAMKYSFSAYNRDYVNGWRKHCAKKYGYVVR